MRSLVVLSALLLSGCGGYYFSINDGDSDARKYPILAAAMDCDIAELRRRAPTEHSTRDRFNRTALQWVFDRNCEEGVMVLLNAGADPNPPDASRGWSPLNSAAASGKLKLVKAMVDRGAKVNGGSIGSMTPLHNAAGSGSAEVVRYLISSGADPQVTDAGRISPFHSGARYPEIVRIFLAAGVDKDARTTTGVTPLLLAHDWPFATQHSGAAGARALLDAGADVNAADVDGLTPLMTAVAACDEPATVEMLRAGAQINATSRDGQTPLQLLRSQVRRERGFGALLWSLIDSSGRPLATCREHLEQTLLAFGAK